MSLTKLLDEQHERLTQLLALLGEEQECLIKGKVDGDALTTLANDKTLLQRMLAQTEERRHEVQCRLGYGDTREGAHQAAIDAGCEERWQATLAVAREVARANLRCGELLSLRMSHNQRMLDHIHKIADAGVYRADGLTRLQSPRLNTSA